MNTQRGRVVLELLLLLEVVSGPDRTKRGVITVLLEAPCWMTVLCLIQRVYFCYSVIIAAREDHVHIHV